MLALVGPPLLPAGAWNGMARNGPPSPC